MTRSCSSLSPLNLLAKYSFAAAGLALIVPAAIAIALKPNREDGMRAVLTAQIEAMQRDDGEAVFAIAAPEIQANFGNAKSFMAMVVRAYPQVYRPRRVDFLEAVEVEGHFLQRVLLTDR